MAPMDKFLSAICLLVYYSTVAHAGSYKPIDVDIPQDVNKIFTAEEIAKYDGSDPSKPLYMGVKGLVFDVSTGKDFYGKGRGYNALVGKDCTRAVAKMSLDPEDLISDISDLGDQDLKSLDDVFKGTYLAKYPVVGIMDYLAKQNVVHEHIHENPLTGEHEHHKDDL